MKIINSHYIPLPEPRWLIVDPVGTIYDQIGTLTVVEDSSKEKGKFGITTHSYPVVGHTAIDNTEETEETNVTENPMPRPDIPEQLTQEVLGGEE
jgi:hypothetical protein